MRTIFRVSEIPSLLTCAVVICVPWRKSTFISYFFAISRFTEDNPVENVANPLEEGLYLLAKGELSSALLLFEMEVQQKPDSVEGWQYLGSTQADNKQEMMAIAALEK